MNTLSKLITPVLIALVVFTTGAGSAKAAAKHKHDHRSASDQRVGIHGMALIKAGNNLLISHLPLHHPMHNMQIVAKVRLNEAAQAQITALFEQHTLVTLLPERFDLNKLISGELTGFSADVYGDHFERGGKKALQAIDFEVSQTLLVKNLNDKNQLKNGSFYRVNLDAQHDLLIHRIAQPNSFDQLLLVAKDDSQNAIVTFEQEVPIKSGEQYQSLYLETQDFQ